jgi:hypothetical protein
LSTSSGLAAEIPRVNGVSVGPGHTTLQVTPWRATSRATLLANPNSPDLVAA